MTKTLYESISRVAGHGNDIKWMDAARREERVNALREKFTQEQLTQWAAEATKRRTAWSERARERNAGRDLMDALRGPYDMSYQIRLVQVAAGERESIHA